MVAVNQQEDEDVYRTPPTHPLPEKTEGDKHMWTIKDYRIWAKTYEEALQHLDMIESF